MYLSPSPEQQELKDAVRRFCGEQITAARLVAWEKEPSGVDEACWRSAVELGWLGLALPVNAGGSGLGLVEVACLLEECSRGLVPRRVINAIRGAQALASCDPASPELRALASGERSVTLACEEEQRRDPSSYQTQVAVVHGEPLVTGEKWYVADAADADLHLVAAQEDGAISLLLVACQAAALVPLRAFDGERQAVVRYARAPVLRRLSLAGQGADTLHALQRQQVALGLAEMIGTMDAVLAMTVDYVKQRELFGQKIGVFQAVQHQVADMATALTAGRHLVWQAITRLAAGSEGGTELATAAAFVGPACKRLTLAAHHLHGGAGYIVEHPLHGHAERAQALCIRYTPEAAALGEVAAALLDGAE